ncbi:expressed protein [Phakopsora pachyrhizi]|uniref:Expressed protein n=1 Tax=Phakopsora pachyrhizi TaxID=170000 RepID=A0AAV0AME0_PHAPC|nr:expressed protein [Phakopsora pachyrhizi]
MTVSVKKKVSFSWISLLLLILLLQSSGAIEAPEDFQWSKIFEEASKIDGKAPLTNVWNLFGDDPIKQHELELNHQIREGPPMVNFYRQYSPRVHQTDPQSSSLHQPNIESRFSSGANEERENTGFGYLGSNSGPMGANNDMYSLEHPHMAKNLQFTSLGDHLHNNFNENFNHIIGGTHPEQRFPTLPELSAGLYHDPEQDKHLHISSIQGNNDYQLYDNCVGKIQNKNLNALDSIHNYQNYDTNLQYDRSTELDKIYANLFSQDYGIYHNQKIGNAENRNHYNGGQNTQDNIKNLRKKSIMLGKL